MHEHGIIRMRSVIVVCTIFNRNCKRNLIIIISIREVFSSININNGENHEMLPYFHNKNLKTLKAGFFRLSIV